MIGDFDTCCLGQTCKTLSSSELMTLYICSSLSLLQQLYCCLLLRLFVQVCKALFCSIHLHIRYAYCLRKAKCYMQCYHGLCTTCILNSDILDVTHGSLHCLN